MHIKIKYIIFEKDEEGRLKHPRYSWCSGYREECIFNEYGYDSFEEAVKDLESKTDKCVAYENFYIIPQVTKEITY
jgi:hypothetical protein